MPSSNKKNIIKRLMPNLFNSKISSKNLITPFQQFTSLEASGGIVMFIAAIVALLWVNFISFESYENIWKTKLTIGITSFSIEETLHFWINEGLMAIFFFVVGLEIKRAMILGDLSSLKKSTFPIMAAIGGMLIPASIFISLNYNQETITGWGIPVATDIAFSLGVLSLLGRKVPLTLKVFLTALAIVDDIGAILIITLFYTSELIWLKLAIAGVLLLILIVANISGMRNPTIYCLLGICIWVCFFHSGIHATIAGVLVAMTVPLKVRINTTEFLERCKNLLKYFEPPNHLRTSKGNSALSTVEQRSALNELEIAVKEVESPLQRLEHNLHYWVAFFIIPFFSLSNSGFIIDQNAFSNASSLTTGIIFGLLAGKPIGIFIFSYLSVKTGIADLPSGVNWKQIIGIGFLAGIGFTMSIFLSGLAFQAYDLIVTSKMAIFTASLLASVIGLLILKLTKTNEF